MLLTALIGAGLAVAAEPTRLVRCDVDLTLPSGAVLTVPGWSHDEDRAAAHAHAVAWAAAHWSDAPRRWTTLAVAPELAGARLADALIAIGTPSAVPGLPPDAVSEPRCERQVPPKARAGSGWAATWPGGEPVHRSTPGIAIEAARRRTCLGAWQEADIDAPFRGNPAASLALRQQARLDDARDALLACLALAPEPADVLAAAPAVPVPPSAGVVQCSAPVHGEGLFAAWGVDLEDAREALLWRTALAAARRTWRVALPSGLSDDDVTAGALAPLHDLVLPDDATEQGALVCATGPREGKPTISWAPRDARIAESCGLSAPTAMELPDPFWLTSSPDALCRQHGTERAMTSVIPELPGAGVDAGPLAAAAWKRALLCEARCWTDRRVEGWSPTPIHRPDELDRTDRDALLARLDAAIAERDLPTLGALTGGVLLARSYRDLVAADPDAFWGSLAATRASPQWAETTTWVPLHGQWVLAFVGS